MATSVACSFFVFLLLGHPALSCMLRVIQCRYEAKDGKLPCHCVRQPLPNTIHDILEVSEKQRALLTADSIQLDNCTAEHYHLKLDLDLASTVEDITLRNLRSSKMTINGYLERNVTIRIVVDDPPVKNTIRRAELQGKVVCGSSYSMLEIHLSGIDQLFFQRFFFRNSTSGCAFNLWVHGASEVIMDESKLGVEVFSKVDSGECRLDGMKIGCDALFLEHELSPSRTLTVVVAGIICLCLGALGVICTKNPKKL